MVLSYLKVKHEKGKHEIYIKNISITCDNKDKPMQFIYICVLRNLQRTLNKLGKGYRTG